VATGVVTRPPVTRIFASRQTESSIDIFLGASAITVFAFAISKSPGLQVAPFHKPNDVRKEFLGRSEAGDIC